MIPGIQVSSFRPVLRTPAEVRTAFQRIAEMGCDTVQLQWIDRRVPIPEIASALRETGLRSIGVQELYADFTQDADYDIELNRATGGTWLTVSRIPDVSPEGLERFAGELRDLQRRLLPLGQEMAFHPVYADYAPVNGVSAVDILLERVPGMALCLDLYHLWRTGTDMPAWITARRERIPMVHFKDARGEELVPAGQGDVDWTGVPEACADVAWGLVEQERWQGDPFDRVREAFDWLRARMA